MRFLQWHLQIENYWNQSWFGRMLTGNGPVICGWGVHGTHRGQDLTVLEWLSELEIEPLALGVTKDGQPRHPLYMPYSSELKPFSGSAR